MNSLDQCPLFRISLVEMSNNLAFGEEFDLVEWALKIEVPAPDNDKISTIHQKTVWVVRNRGGLIKLSKSYPSFFLQAFALSK